MDDVTNIDAIIEKCEDEYLCAIQIENEEEMTMKFVRKDVDNVLIDVFKQFIQDKRRMFERYLSINVGITHFGMHIIMETSKPSEQELTVKVFYQRMPTSIIDALKERLSIYVCKVRTRSARQTAKQISKHNSKVYMMNNDLQEFMEHVLETTNANEYAWPWYNENHSKILIRRVEIIKLLNEYVMYNNLYQIREDSTINKRILQPNNELKKVLRLKDDVILSIFNLQSYITGIVNNCIEPEKK
jgi:hypothetical protein